MGSGGPGYTIKAEFNKRPFDRGVLGMARTNDPDSAGSQIYIMLGPSHFLNGKYTAFGKVASGMDVVDQIKVGDRIKTVRIVQVATGFRRLCVTQTAVITLENGEEIHLEFFPADAPKTVENFVTLAKKGFYNGLTFHRVVPDFVVQGGCPKGDGTGGPGHTVKAEFNKQKHLRGSLAMARSQHPDSAGSQFYITYGPTPHLDNNYTVFGRVTSGMEHVDRIKQGDRMKTVVVNEA